MKYNYEPTCFHEHRPNLAIMVGPPGSGKSTYAKIAYPWHIRISQDEMGRAGHWDAFVKAIESGKEIVIDRMNFDRHQRFRYWRPAQKAGYNITMVLFLVDSDECLRRMECREGHPTLNDPKKYREVLDFFSKNYETPTIDEFSQLKVIRNEDG